ncbi:MAG: archease [Deltaproteobacteria bacterium]|nr:archease [Deltaproteobacteria bacterium]
MPYSYMEHASDVGIHAEGETIGKAFESGAEAMLNVMFDLSTIRPTVDVTFSAEAGDEALLFVEVLNEILSIQDRHSLAVKRLEAVEIKQTGSGLSFIGRIYGEPFNPEKHAVKTEVKAATYSGLSCVAVDGKYILECVVDV